MEQIQFSIIMKLMFQETILLINITSTALSNVKRLAKTSKPFILNAKAVLHRSVGLRSENRFQNENNHGDSCDIILYSELCLQGLVFTIHLSLHVSKRPKSYNWNNDNDNGERDQCILKPFFFLFHFSLQGFFFLIHLFLQGFFFLIHLFLQGFFFLVPLFLQGTFFLIPLLNFCFMSLLVRFAFLSKSSNLVSKLAYFLL